MSLQFNLPIFCLHTNSLFKTPIIRCQQNDNTRHTYRCIFKSCKNSVPVSTAEYPTLSDSKFLNIEPEKNDDTNASMLR